MKYLIRLKKEDNSFVDMQTVDEEYIYKHKEVEELPYKEGFFVTYEYDKEQDIITGRYEELSKTETQILKEEIDKLKRAIVEGKTEQDLDLGELGTLSVDSSPSLSSQDLSELDQLESL